MDPIRPADLGTTLRNLLSPFSVEITPREAPTLPPLPELLAPGTAVYLTFLPNAPWAETVAVARTVREAGMRPVPLSGPRRSTHGRPRPVGNQHRSSASNQGPGGARTSSDRPRASTMSAPTTTSPPTVATNGR